MPVIDVDGRARAGRGRASPRLRSRPGVGEAGRWRPELALLAGSCLFALALAEIATRVLFPYYTPATMARHAIAYRPAVYARFVMEAQDRIVDLDSDKTWGVKPESAPSERRIYISPNGLRGPAFEPIKPAGVRRVLFLGGSSVFDQYVSDEQPGDARTWPHLAGERLEAAGLGAVEVINGGVAGYVTADSLARLVAEFWMYSPDVVVLYQGWNDIKYFSLHGLSPERPLIAEVEPYDPATDVLTHYRSGLDRFLSNSQFYVKLRNRFLLSRREIGAEGVVPEGTPLATDYAPYGLRQYRLNVETIVAAARAIGARPVLVTQATLATAGAGAEAREKISYRYVGLEHEALVRAFDEIHAALREVAEKHEVPLVDAAAALSGRVELFEDGIHTTPAGSRALAAIVAEGLAAVLGPPPGLSRNVN